MITCRKSIYKIITKVYAGHVKDTNILKYSSSGGAFTAFSGISFRQGDAVITSVYDYRNAMMECQLISSAEERNTARGSKYIQSRPGDI